MYIYFHTRQFLHWCLPRWFLRCWTSVNGWQCLCYSAIYFWYPMLSLFAWKIFTAGLGDGLLGYPHQHQAFYIAWSRVAASWIIWWVTFVECFTIKELQSLLSKLSFVTDCIHATSHVGNASQLGLVANFSSPLQWHFGYQAHQLVFCWFLFHHGCLFGLQQSHVPQQVPYIPFPRLPCLTFLLWNSTLYPASNWYTVIVALKFWAPVLQNRRFFVSCNNKAAVTMINPGSTKDTLMQRCLQ